jgi:hypothetical protein
MERTYNREEGVYKGCEFRIGRDVPINEEDGLVRDMCTRIASMSFQ